jgi:hypothetical protein
MVCQKARNGKRSNLKETREKHYTTRQKVGPYKKEKQKKSRKKERRRT